ncbi:pilin [Patescibacteria group bacterium]
MQFDNQQVGQFSGLATLTPDLTIQGLIGLVLVVAVVLSLGFLIWGGLDWLSSKGDPEKLKQARKKISSALIGLLVVFSTWGLLSLVGIFTGIDLISGRESASAEGDGGTNSQCECGGNQPEFCASSGQIGPIGVGGECFVCDSDLGWQPLGHSNCQPIVCSIRCS